MRSTHLELVQRVINRMASNSFVLKGWSVTLVTALAALGAGLGSWTFPAISLLPAISFWALDAYYLRQERLYRELYDAVRRGQLRDDPFSMDTSNYAPLVHSLLRTCRSQTVAIFHVAVVAAVIAMILVLLPNAMKGA